MGGWAVGSTGPGLCRSAESFTSPAPSRLLWEPARGKRPWKRDTSSVSQCLAQGPGRGAPSPALDARPGCRGPRSACCQGICFLTKGTGKPWTGSLFLFSPAQGSWVLDILKINKGNTEGQNVGC